MTKLPPLIDIKTYNSIELGVSFLKTLSHEKTFGIEGCKLRCMCGLSLKLLSIILDDVPQQLTKFDFDDIVRRSDLDEHNKMPPFQDICYHIGNGMSKTFMSKGEYKYTQDMIALWWPYCKFCPPRGYNCYISFSFDFLEFLSQIMMAKKLTDDLIVRLKGKTQLAIQDRTASNLDNMLQKFGSFQKWLNEDVIDCIEKHILERPIEKNTIKTIPL